MRSDDPADGPGAPSRRELHELCLDWVEWGRSKRLFDGPRLSPGLLARMQPSTRRGGEPPDADLVPFLVHLNTAISCLELTTDKKAFLHFYGRTHKNVKRAAEGMGISRQMFYRKVHAFATLAYRHARVIERGHQRAAAPWPELVVD